MEADVKNPKVVTWGMILRHLAAVVAITCGVAAFIVVAEAFR